MADSNLSAERFREVLHYDAETGLLIWRARTARCIKIGDIAGTIGPKGYIVIRIDGHNYKAHRLAWFYVHGAWPLADIDHLDGNPSNNRLDNLREATRSENQQNQRKANMDNKSCDMLGASWHKRAGKFRAQIVVGGKKRHLGYFHTAEAAHVAYVTAKRVLHPFGLI